MNHLAIDDLLMTMHRNYTIMFSINQNDSDVMSSVGHQLLINNDLTHKQRVLITKIITRSANQIVENNIATRDEVTYAVNNPKFSSNLRRLIDSNSVEVDCQTHQLKLRFPYDRSIIDQIKEYRNATGSSGISYSAATRAWEFPLREENIQFISTLFTDLDADEKFNELSAEIKRIIRDFEQYLPIIEQKNNQFQYRNTSPTIPRCDESSLILALLHARKHGIFCWDDQIDHQLHSKHTREVNAFLRNGSMRAIENGGKISEYEELIISSPTTLITIPEGNELTIVSDLKNQFNSMGIPDDKMSVYFRLAGKPNPFNEFVKNNLLNNDPLTDSKIRVIFISGKPSKKLVEAKRYFDIVFQIGSDRADFKARNFTYSQPNLVKIAY